MATYYLSGPMRGLPHHNRVRFADVEEALNLNLRNSDDYDTIINPARNFEGDQTRDTSDYMNLDFQQVLTADVIVLLPDWQMSEGARREVQLATWAGKHFWLAGNGGDGGWSFWDADPAELDDALPVRAQTLYKAAGLVTGDRNNAYGPPHADFRRSSDAMTAYGYRHTQLAANDPPCTACGARPMQSHDTAIMVDCVKTSRLMWTPTKEDSWIDKAGYAGCGYECAMHDEAERLKAAS